MILLHYQISNRNLPLTISTPEKRGHGAPGDALALRRAQFRPGDGERAAYPQVLPEQNRTPVEIFSDISIATSITFLVFDSHLLASL